MKQDLVPLNGDMSVASSDSLITIAEQAEKRIEAIKKIKQIALRITNAGDWTDQNGKPYPQVSGSEKIARTFGIGWTIDSESPKKEIFEDGHFAFEFKGKFFMGPSEIEVIGTRNSRDPFFTTRYKDGNKISLPPSEIDSTDVKKASLTNCIGNGITRLLGIRNMTWDEVEEFASFKREDVEKIQYKKKGKSGNTKSSSGQPGRPPGPMTEKQRKMLYAKMKEAGLSNEECKSFFAMKFPEGSKPTTKDASAFIDSFDKDLEAFKDLNPKKQEDTRTEWECPQWPEHFVNQETCDACDQKKDCPAVN